MDRNLLQVQDLPVCPFASKGCRRLNNIEHLAAYIHPPSAGDHATHDLPVCRFAAIGCRKLKNSKHVAEYFHPPAQDQNTCGSSAQEYDRGVPLSKEDADGARPCDMSSTDKQMTAKSRLYHCMDLPLCPFASKGCNKLNNTKHVADYFHPPPTAESTTQGSSAHEYDRGVPASKEDTDGAKPCDMSSTDKPMTTKNQLYHCMVCNVTTTGVVAHTEHVKGKRHASMLAQQAEAADLKDLPLCPFASKGCNKLNNTKHVADYFHPPPTAESTIQLPVPLGAVETIIERMQHIQTDSGTRVNLLPDGAQEVCSIKGTPEGVEKASRLILDIVQTCSEGQEAVPDPADEDEDGPGGARGGGGWDDHVEYIEEHLDDILAYAEKKKETMDDADASTDGEQSEERCPYDARQTTSFPVPADKCGRVIGKGGTTIRDIIKKTGAQVKLQPTREPNPAEKVFLISGNSDQIQHAKTLIADKTGIMWVPRSAVGLIIGCKGDVIKRIERESGAKVHFKKPDDDQEFQLCSIEGAPDKVREASRMIMDIIQSYHDREDDIDQVQGATVVPETPVRTSVNEGEQRKKGEKDRVHEHQGDVKGGLDDMGDDDKTKAINKRAGRRTAKGACNTADSRVELQSTPEANPPFSRIIPIPRVAVGKVIGSQGKTVHQIQDETNTRIHFLPDDGKELQVCSIEGTRDSVTKAYSMVVAIVESCSSCKSSGVQDKGAAVGPDDADASTDGDEQFEERSPCDARQTISFGISASVCGLVIGKGGSTIKKITKESGASVDLQPLPDLSEKVVVISGSPDQIQHAKELIQTAIASEKSMDIILERRFHKSIIGASGSKIREIRALFNGIQIHFPGPDCESDVVTLKGRAHDVDNCYQHLLQVHAELLENNYEGHVRIAKRFHRNVIGKDGATIKNIRDETDTKIDIPKENVKSDVITVTGRKTNVELAVAKIEAIPNRDLQDARPPALRGRQSGTVVVLEADMGYIQARDGLFVFRLCDCTDDFSSFKEGDQVDFFIENDLSGDSKAVSVSIRGNKGRDSNKDQKECRGVLTAQPKYWETMDKKLEYTLVELSVDDEEFQVAALHFTEKFKSPVYIEKVYRVQNPILWTKYRTTNEDMAKKNSGAKIQSKFLFHGSDWDALKGIMRNGFDWRRSGKNAAAYGDGCYFSENSNYSHQYSSTGNVLHGGHTVERFLGSESYCNIIDKTKQSSHSTPFTSQILEYKQRGVRINLTMSSNPHCYAMLRVRVLVGKYCVGQSGWRRPPPLDSSNPSGVSYNTCVDTLYNPTMFIVFEHGQAYPEHLIVYSEASGKGYAPRAQPHSAGFSSSSRPSVSHPGFYSPAPSSTSSAGSSSSHPSGTGHSRSSQKKDDESCTLL